MSFIGSTRRKLIPLATLTDTSGNPLLWDIPKTGILAGIYLNIAMVLGGTQSAPNALGMQAGVKKVRLIANSGIDLINISGVGYNSLLRDYLEAYGDVVPHSSARSAVSAATFQLPMYLPIAINSRDPVGLFMLQNEQTLLQLSVEYEAAANLATGATLTSFTVTPYVEVFTVPVSPKDWPDFSLVHQIVEDQRSISGAMTYEYIWPRGNTYLQVLHGAGLAQSGSDAWTRAQMRVNQSDYLLDYVPQAMNTEFTRTHGRARLAGVIGFDLLGSSGLGNYGSTRDLLFSGAVTDLSSVLAISGATTLYTVRRQLISLK